ncbi:DUF1178 family protein [Pseudomonadota bacterium]
MILYQLRCSDEHSFEAWFRDAASYDEQAATGHVECPYCGSTQIAKAPEMMQPTESGEAVTLDDAALDNARARDVARKILDAVNEGREEEGADYVRLADSDRRDS